MVGLIQKDMCVTPATPDSIGGGNWRYGIGRVIFLKCEVWKYCQRTCRYGLGTKRRSDVLCCISDDNLDDTVDTDDIFNDNTGMF